MRFFRCNKKIFQSLFCHFRHTCLQLFLQWTLVSITVRESEYVRAKKERVCVCEWERKCVSNKRITSGSTSSPFPSQIATGGKRRRKILSGVVCREKLCVCVCVCVCVQRKTKCVCCNMEECVCVFEWSNFSWVHSYTVKTVFLSKTLLIKVSICCCVNKLARNPESWNTVKAFSYETLSCSYFKDLSSVSQPGILKFLWEPLYLGFHNNV